VRGATAGGIVLSPNPAVPPGTHPAPACHDGSRFLTIQCRCGFFLHVHETQLEHVPDGAEVALRCTVCRAAPGYDAATVRAAIRAAWEPRP